RLTTFFVLGAACVGTVVAYNDESLLQSLSAAKPGAGSSPYVIAMQRLKIPFLLLCKSHAVWVGSGKESPRILRDATDGFRYTRGIRRIAALSFAAHKKAPGFHSSVAKPSKSTSGTHKKVTEINIG
ncbi:hypothetical protein MPER_01809, partial [Moniliophthora perniciosa FA553]